MTLDGLMALFSRLLPQAFTIQQAIARIQTAYSNSDYITVGLEVGTISRNIIGQPVNR